MKLVAPLAAGVPRVTIALMAFALLIVGLETLIAVPAAAIAKMELLDGAGAYAMGGALALTALLLTLIVMSRLRGKLALWLSDPGQSRSTDLLLPLAVGLSLRLLVILSSSVSPTSDAGVFVTLGEMLASGKPYYFAHRWAYWPVGYPFLLSIWFRLLGSSLWTVQLLNLLLYATTTSAVGSVCARFGTRGAALIAMWILALWPDLVVLSAWPSKELVAMTLLMSATALLVRSHAISFPRLGAAGALSGLLVLVQPSFLLLLPVLPALRLMSPGHSLARFAREWIIVLLAAAAIVLPWTYRNYTVLGEVVPVATNGGEVLYRANNPLARGDYMKRGEVDLWELPELEANRIGMALAKQWIAANPRAFLQLAVRKQLYFLEDDGIGVYEVFQRGRVGGAVSSRVYFLLKAACNAFWWAMWLVVTSALILVARHPGRTERLAFILVGMPVVYLYGIHSVFESGPRYHQPADPFLALTAGLALTVAVACHRQAKTGNGLR